MKFQVGTSSLNDYGGRRYNPYAFTEQGVAMLATILRTSVAAEVSIKIMRAFVAMRKYISSNLIEQKYINNLGTSINNAGTKTFAINKIEDIRIINSIKKLIE